MKASMLKQLLFTHRLFFDGGTGTLLQAEGLRPGERPETWNLSRPDVIRDLHLAYFRAGANLVKSNTFGINTLHYDVKTASELTRAAVGLAKEAAALADRENPAAPHLVALDIGPLGVMLKPLGTLDFEEAVSCFSHVVRTGVEAGCDCILIETMADAYETKAAVLAAKENSALPVLVTNTYDGTGKLMTGADPLAMVALLEGLSVDAIGLNCSAGPLEMLPLVRILCENASVPVIVNPNAGLPRVDEAGNTVYDIAAEEFALYMEEIVSLGAQIVGGCCGTTPQHIAETVKRCGDLPYTPPTEKGLSLVSSYTHAVRLGGSRVTVIGERINPTGKKLLKEALRRHDVEYILSLAEKQESEGADVLDVNVGLPELDEAAILTEVMEAIQQVTDLPLQLDTGNGEAMERALRRYNGKALLNSVTGKDESMRTVFPLAKKYGGVVVALTLDENGIPATAEGRLEIAEKILRTAKEYGLAEKDLLFDPLALTVSSDGKAPRVTLEAIRLIRERLGCNTSLGVSNVSFGLPGRDLLNGTFFALALHAGLNAAILNPASQEMQRALCTYEALMGLDERCERYIAFASQAEGAPVQNIPAPSPRRSEAEAEGSALFRAILGGRKEEAQAEAARLGADRGAMAVVSGEIVPALDRVGKDFESGKRFLPQLLIAAECAKAAFTALEPYFGQSDGEKKGKVVLATVKGDVHDIGKNIVKVVLESYGYAVCDLGRDVPKEVILDAVRREKPLLLGLSALMTTTAPAMGETIALLREAGQSVPVAVGGAVLTKEYADRIGARFYCRDAMETVRAAEICLKEAD